MLFFVNTTENLTI